MNRLVSKLLCPLIFALALPSLPAVAAEDFTGAWSTTYGRMVLKQSESDVTGYYFSAGAAPATLKGSVDDRGKLSFTYQEETAAGEGWFELTDAGQGIDGQWRENGTEAYAPWSGKRIIRSADTPPSFAGVWQTSFGKMRLINNHGEVTGAYNLSPGCHITGIYADGKLSFRYEEPDAAGEGEFELSPDGQSFSGRWRASGQVEWNDWYGVRVEPAPNRVYLLVLEARWEKSYEEREYAFGEMLKAYLARDSNVEVRHRYFAGEDELRHWLAEVQFLAEPVVVNISSHGSPAGSSVLNKTIGPAAFVETLRYASNVRLLHFGGCEVMQGDMASDIHAQLPAALSFPISGYNCVVDWGASAVIEFLYMELVLMQAMDPVLAIEQVKRGVVFARDVDAPGVAWKATGLRIVTRTTESEASASGSRAE